MNRQTAIKVLSEWDSKGRYVFTLHDLAKLFPDDKPKTLQEGVNRLVRSGLLQRACRGVYVYSLARSSDSHDFASPLAIQIYVDSAILAHG